MIPELGHFALILALCVALAQGLVPLAGAVRGDARWIAFARPAAAVQFVLVACAFGALAWSFAQNDFSVAYVATNSNTKLPLAYRLSAVWGGHEGSLLLWILMLAGWTLAIALASGSLPEAMVGRTIGVLGLVAAAFHTFILFTSNPFERLIPAAAEGRDLNPLLQDPGLVVHPPMLYMGYVGFSVAFALSIAALASGRLDAAWARWSRPWTIAAWVFLTLGITLGSVWAYYELGWGGWWFWDPVENASFMPWLVGTALIHSLAVTEKRGALKSWTLLLAIAAFSLCLLGTFLVRSGVLTSVHAFATDPRRGVFILVLLALVIGGSLVLFAVRAPRVASGGEFDLVSRETFLLSNNVLLTVAAGTVLLGTLYPLAVEALALGKISVGPPYFNTVFVPLMVPLLFLVALGPRASWRSARVADLAREMKYAFVFAVAGGLLIPFVMGAFAPLVALSMFLVLWIAASGWLQVRSRAVPARAGALAAGAALARQPRHYWGMHLAHLGLAVFVVGVALSKGYESEKEVRMAPGEILTLGDYSLRMLKFSEAPGPNYTAVIADIELLRDGKVLKVLRPEKRKYFSSQNPMTEAAIDPGLTRDVYVSIGEPLGGGAWSVRAHVKPFVDWIWGGGLLMALGGILALSDRRYRVKVRAPAQAGALAAERA
ncbi:MAG: heme lyase CcmF/NrfE family subunit [Betaproteobacteria bacterium]|nr:heme lyase CcmF/NrfE family subunit [Betaproteobacteria bacterium]